MSLIENIKESEGFVGTPYNDSLDYPTIGYGTKLPLSKEEAELILKHRLDEKIEHLQKEKPFVVNLPQNTQDALYEMAYQLGVNGLLKFKKMWRALKSGEFEEASKEALDSRWAKQTPNRANKLASIIGNLLDRG